MSTLRILSEGDSFSALWPEMARELEMELQMQHSVAEVSGSGTALVLVVAGREDTAEALLRALTARGITGALVVGTEADHRLALSLAHAGAADYFALPGDIEVLRATLAEMRQREQAQSAREALARAERSAFDFSRMVGRSPALRAALDRAARIIPREAATVLITGETGTGKELLAQAIHYNGPRASAPFVEVNCAAIPGHLLEAELFGYEKGAFTDARTAKPGLFEAAHGGTLFLDEIGHLPLELQGKILKAIEEKQVRRLGALGMRRMDARIIAATHVELADAVRRGEFREDLFYRLSVIPIHLPPLRERGEDVLLLAEHFLTTLAAQYRIPAPPLPPELRSTLLAYGWPGNVRELRNALERALLLGDGALSVEDLFLARPSDDTAPPALPFPAPLDEIERAAARVMLERLGGNKKAAADALAISRSRLYRLLDPSAAVAEDVPGA
ncbi:MAG TPA: sigma-54 dependent transcriptional regulator [Longimicrobiaceae bacterium]|nr:sigma-54 dependent transcriptional regulator [Longimicrobiaceae bacterium]